MKEAMLMETMVHCLMTHDLGRAGRTTGLKPALRGKLPEDTLFVRGSHFLYVLPPQLSICVSCSSA